MAPSSAPAKPYGRACMNCSRSKCRCVSRPGGQGCTRCHRLKQTCVSGQSIRAVNAQKNNPIARITQLESKLDGLMSLLGSGMTVNTHAATPQSPPPSTVTSTQSRPTPVTTCSGSAPSIAFEPSVDEAERYLHRFRTDMLQYFPFLHLPYDVQWMRQERPFLCLCIMAASVPSTDSKLVLGERIKQTLAQHFILDTSPGSVTVDLLLGLLAFLAWGHDYILHSSPSSLSRFTQLAMAIVFELRLNKPLPEESNMLPGFGQSQKCSTESRCPARSLEEIRAVLGCFMISSVVSCYLAQIDAMQWTPYMEKCLGILSSSGECPNDELFAHQVRLQLIVGEAESARHATTPPAFYFKALKLKVDRIKAQISPQLRNNRILFASLSYTELSVSVLALSGNYAAGFHRLEHQYACVNTLKGALDNFFQTPVSEYSGVSFPFFTHLSLYIVVLYKLSTINDPLLDTELVRSTVDVLQVMDRLIGNIQHARSLDGESSAGGLLDRSIKIFMSVRSWCAATLNEQVVADDAKEAASHTNSAVEREIPLECAPLDCMPLEDMWFKDYFNLGLLDETEPL